MSEEKVVAFVLAVVEVGKEYELLERIKKVAAQEGVDVEAYVVFGEYDLAVKLSAENLKKLDKAVTMIRNLPGILRTVTLIAST